MFVQDDKQSDPAALEHQQMNSDEVRVNIRRADSRDDECGESTHTCAHVLVLGPGSGDQHSLEAAATVSAMFGNAELLRLEQWRHWLLTGFQPV